MPHIHDLIDYTVSAPIVHEGKVLMIHHKLLNRWLFVGGHVELDEDPEEAIYREAKEESGLTIELIGTRPIVPGATVKMLIAPTFLNIHPVNEHHRHIDMMYVAKAKTADVTLAAEEHHDIRWFSPADLDDPQYDLMPDIQFYAKEALKLITS